MNSCIIHFILHSLEIKKPAQLSDVISEGDRMGLELGKPPKN
jgi:hypothetical protein